MGYQKDVHYFTAMDNNKSAKCERQRNTYFSVTSCVFYLDTSNNLLTHTEPRQQQLTLRARKAGSNSFKLVSLQQWGDISLFFFRSHQYGHGLMPHTHSCPIRNNNIRPYISHTPTRLKLLSPQLFLTNSRSKSISIFSHI